MPVCVSNRVPSGSVASCEDGLPNHYLVLLTDQLKNSEVLLDLDCALWLGQVTHNTELVKLIDPNFFGDVPSCTRVNTTLT